MSRTQWIPLAGIVLTCIAPFAKADTVDLTFNTVSPYRAVSITVDNGAHFESTWAGIMQWTRTGGAAIGDPDNTLQTFCVEVTQNVNFSGQYTYTLAPIASTPNDAPPGFVGVWTGMGAAKALMLRELWGQHYASIGVDADKAAAFQLATWNIVYDTDLDVTAGNMRFSLPTGPIPSYATIANQWLTTLDPNGALANLGGITNTTIQDQIYDLPPSPAPLPVPLPSAAWSGLGLMLAIAAARARRALRA
jgi:hypothetical protein